MPTLRYGIYKVLEASDKQNAAMAKLEAELAGQDTPKEAEERRTKEITATIIASVVALMVACFFDWFNDPSFPVFTFFRAMPVMFVWAIAYRIAGPPSRASLYLAEQQRLKAEKQAARNAKIRADKIRRGL